MTKIENLSCDALDMRIKTALCILDDLKSVKTCDLTQEALDFHKMALEKARQYCSTLIAEYARRKSNEIASYIEAI